MNFNDALLIVEKRTKEQQERGQRAMTIRDLDPFIRLKRYFMNKWHNTGVSGLKNKKVEIERYKEVIRDSVKESKLTSPKLKEFLKREMGFYPKIKAVSSSQNFGFAFDDETMEKLLFVNKDFIDNETDVNGIHFNNDKSIRPIIKKFLIAHEYGHLYDFLKRYIETGVKDTVDTRTGGDKEVKNSEGLANAYAINNLYRKDRRKLLTNSENELEYNKKLAAQKNKKLGAEVFKIPDEDARLMKLYFDGTKDKSDIFKKYFEKKEKEKK